MIVFPLSKLWQAKFLILCHVLGEAAGEIGTWSLYGVKGLRASERMRP